ncbi:MULTISPECIES: MFS transporter [unclassified Streptomyces]|uniref:MFS transporter n=1 Tax=unclassified Streptomyces TaxID=2593676 RepID=UPI002DDACE58|nr:MFS transporter [Streptomyces sp. NBC_01750]WSA98111.1 MFS transporter [Streptomyces sp. NBC_01794]WSD37352.1 MFS transporter [Streptomyces sp. NBC_01750]
MSQAAESTTGTITTKVPARLDRLPWSRWHWMIVIGLGTVWILDGLEVTVVGNIAARLSEDGSGLPITDAQVTGVAAALYVAGACSGALFFGRLTDRYGRKRLFLITLAAYLAATALTAVSFSVWWFFLFRFLTGFGIGGEYAAINSAIDELIPSKYRGRVDLIINGSYWLGAMGGALLSVVALNTDIFPKDVGWRLTFALGVVLGLVILLVRRHVPESPRWMFIHGRSQGAEQLVDGVERQIEAETGRALPEPEGAITIEQRRSTGFLEIARTLFRSYPKRAALGFALFIGQAFLYNAITFGFGSILVKFFDVSSGSTGYFFAAIAFGNFLGPLLLGRLFDTIGRRPMIAGTYILSGLLLFVTAWFFSNGWLNATTMTVCWAVVLFFASAGASSAYLTVSEIFPMETRAMSIAFFYAIGTAAGGISGPLLFADLTASGVVGDAVLAFCVGASLMVLAGLVAVFFAVAAERKPLEAIATPLSARQAQGSSTPGAPAPAASP